MKKIYLFLLFIFSVNLVNSQKLDTKYGIDGRQLIPVRNTYVQVWSAIVQKDKKLLIGGSTSNDEGDNGKITAWRLNADGSLDSSFGNLGLPGITELFYGYSPLGRGGLLALQPDNKILLAGTNLSYTYGNVITLARLKQNGKLDSTFGENGAAHLSFNGSIYADLIPYGLAIKSNKKIVINGDIGISGGNAELIQVRADGKLDSSFGVNGVLKRQSSNLSIGLALTVLSDNKIIGGFEYIDNENKVQTCLKKYMPSGETDNSFGDNGIVLNKNPHTNVSAVSLALQPDGKIVEYTVGHNSNILLRYKKNGDIDKSFGNNGRVYVPFIKTDGLPVLSVALDENGKILITSGDGYSIARYLANGVIDSSFANNGILHTDFSDIAPDYAVQRVRCVAVQPDSKIIELGQVSYAYEQNDELAIARYKNVPQSTLTSNAVKAAIKTNNAFVIYPNPVNNILAVNGLNIKEQYSFEIRNATGKIMIAGKANNAASYNCNVQKLNSGIYYVRIISNSIVQTLKFIKQ